MQPLWVALTVGLSKPSDQRAARLTWVGRLSAVCISARLQWCQQVAGDTMSSMLHAAAVALVLSLGIHVLPALCRSRIPVASIIPVRLYSKDDTTRQACTRLSTCGRMLLRVARVMLTDGPAAAFSWVENARRVSLDPSLGPGFTHTIETGSRVVPDGVAESIDAMFRERAASGERNAFAQSGQSIAYQHDFPQPALPALERLYMDLLEQINAELPALRLHPIKASFAERFYAIDYPGPTISLDFHYDCNDPSDYKAQILLEKTPDAPSLWVGGGHRENLAAAAAASADQAQPLPQRPFDEDVKNICVFHPHSTFHGIPQGTGTRRVLICTFTKLVDDHRPLVCHADLVSK